MNMKRILALILAGIMLLGAAGVAVFAAESSTVATIDDNTYDTLQLAADAVRDGEQGIIKLQSDAAEMTVEAETLLDLNGYDIEKLNVVSGTCYVMDSQTVDFAAGDYGIIAAYTGDVQPFCTPEEDGTGWLMIDDNGTNASFHYVVLQITDMVLRPRTEGETTYNPSLYYKCAFKGDEVVAQNVKTFGVALSVVEEPNVSNLQTKCGYSVFTDFQPGESGNAEQNTGTILRGIMKETNANLVNKRNANLTVYGRAYLELANGEYAFGECRNRTLKEQTEGANRLWTLFDDAKKEDIRQMYQRYPNIMQTWNLTGVTTDFSNVVEDAVTWYEEFENLPVVNSSMTETELRQLVMDTFRLQLTYKWTPNDSFTYLDFENDYTTLSPNTVYLGTPYVMSKIYFDSNKDGVVDEEEQKQEGNIGCSNLYKVMKYYDPATGVLDIQSMGSPSNISNILVNNCSGGLAWALGRVSNNHSLFTSNHYLPVNGALPVGRIILNEAEITKVDDRGEIQYDMEAWDDKLFTFDWLSGQNSYGQKKADFYKSYVEAQPGDILITPGHVRMVTAVEAPKKSDGTNDYNNWYVWYIDQNSHGSTDRWALVDNSEYLSTQSNGKTVRNLGGMMDDPVLGTRVSVQQLFKDQYIPLTIPEFCTEAELTAYKEKAAGYFEAAGKTELWESTYAPKYDELIAARGIEDPLITTTSSLYTQTKMTPTKFYDKHGSFSSNYLISHFRVTIEDKNGNLLEEEYPHVNTGDRSRSVNVDTMRDASTLLSMETLTKYAGKGNRVKIHTYLSTGQWYTPVNFEIG